MSATALPPLPTPDKTGAGSAKQASQAPDKVGDSEFDSVSRQERQRLDRNRDRASARADGAEVAEKPPSDAGKAPAPATSEAEGRPAGNAATADGQQTATADLTGAAVIESPGEPAPVFTFAQLQDLMMPAQTPAAAVPATTGPTGAVAGVTALAGGLSPVGLAGSDTTPGLRGVIPGITGKAAKAGADSAGRLMAEGVMAQLAGDGGKATDTGLASLGRMQAGLDAAAQTQLLNPGQKVPEAMIPLKGYATSIELPVGHAEWGDKLVGKLAWLTSQKLSVAEIHLTPPDMGPLEVRVQVQNDQANVTIHAANPAVRDQLELHSHRLRDMLSGQGLDLQNFDVADSPGRGGAEDDGEGRQTAGGDGAGDGEPGDLALAESAGSLDLTWRGEVDLYA